MSSKDSRTPNGRQYLHLGVRSQTIYSLELWENLRSYSCLDTEENTDYHHRISTTEQISRRSSKAGLPISYRYQPAVPSERTCRPALSYLSISLSIKPNLARRVFSVTASWHMFRLRNQLLNESLTS